ncbi:hypothetical protein [Paraburkholderia sp. SIMBA_054]
MNENRNATPDAQRTTAVPVIVVVTDTCSPNEFRATGVLAPSG